MHKSLYTTEYLTMFNIEGKVALVTGGAAGIGFETARQLLENGAKGVVIADIEMEAGEAAFEKLGREFGKTKVVFAQTDVSDKDSFEGAFKRTLSEFKNIDILVNNAGISNECNYEKTIAVNLTGTVHGTFLAIENYILNHKTGPDGIIINTSSIAGCHPFPGAPIYGATKSGVVSLTLSLGHPVHFEKTKIKVVAIAPSRTETNIFDRSIHRSKYYEAISEQIISNIIIQSAAFVAKEIIKIIEEKPSGTIWICENNQEIYEYDPAAYVKSNIELRD